MKVTFDDQSPDAIRMGDEVTTSDGFKFTAYSDAELDQWGEYGVKTHENKWRTFTPEDRVTLSYVDDSAFSLSY